MKNRFDCLDCMDGMAEYPDKFFDLAIVDPPYGVGNVWEKSKRDQFYSEKNFYDNSTRPDRKYFKELFRVSKNQIIWGGNYFAKHLSPTNSLIIWDKLRDVEKTFMSEGELAWTSFKVPLRFFRYQWDGGKKSTETGVKKIHPFQKPVELYRWTLKKYAKPGQIILDTHVGSGSSLIGCEDMGFTYVGFDNKPHIVRKAKKRIRLHTRQVRMI